MRFDHFKNKINKVARQKPEGFTFNPLMNYSPQKGYAVAVLETQNSTGKAGLFKVVKYYMKHLDHFIGGWRNEDGMMQYDVIKIYLNINEAINAAIRNKQRAIYNLYTGHIIMACDYECCQQAA